ncbi:hypothetical protein OYT1_ch1478 [Ferriphaselus amnicola]|uniref:O-antigen polymerase n=1 Tax=Ferriphaselus amnicola TaxID=1188319 RepID=A0A2Z6GCC6_9PROT|nr:hypothetical protein [Ferriphaselus amnicola]BBE51032.1 hypothetical protein OYT1_ch1478 [Ferriphaselus amnicola]
MSANKNSVFIRWLLALAGGLIFLMWPLVLEGIFPDAIEGTLPSPVNLVPGLLAWYVIAQVKCPYSRLLGYVWLAWYCIGTLNTIASSLVLGGYYSQLDMRVATQIYLWATVFYFLGLYLFERLLSSKYASVYGGENPSPNIHPIVATILMVFPFSWLLSMYISIGYIPILSGGSIVDEMYEIGYGPLYPYGVIIAVSILYAGYKAMVEAVLIRRYAYGLLALVCILISMADGKRGIAMIALGGLIGISFRVLQHKTWTKTLPILTYSLVTMYVGTLLLRVGEDSARYVDAYSKMMLIGVEFRDFVYTVNFFEPGEIANYSWATSTIAAMTNNLMLTLIGLDKGELTSLDSAHAWSAIWNTTFGIRTGIVSELWFAYGIFAMPLILVLGLLSGYVIKKLKTLRGERGVLFMATLFGLLSLLITSQSTFTAGVLPVLLYLYLAMRLFGHVLGRRFAEVAINPSNFKRS